METTLQKHPIPPFIPDGAKILILGSFPSVKSREQMFFYGHPQNRFWKVTSSVFGEETPLTVEEKSAFLTRCGIALWDVIESCEITGSSDSSIKNVKPNDIKTLITKHGLKRIFVNGKTAEKLYIKHLLPLTETEAVYLPSTSPANAGISVAQLIEKWSIINTEA